MSSPLLREDPSAASVISVDDARSRRRIAALRIAHDGYLRGLARKLCRAYVDPDDLVQDLFEKLITTSALPEAANERAWLARVMHNLFIDKLRRATARREDSIEDAEPPVAPPLHTGADAPWWDALDEASVRAAVAQLPAEQRATFEMFVFEGKPYDAIAAELGIAKATVGTRILRARQKLRELLVAAHGGGE